MTHLIQTANGQLMLQTINSPGPAGQIQVGSQHPHLQQIQVLPISSLQVNTSEPFGLPPADVK